MKKDFEKELTELINKHGMEKVFGDTPDFILAKVAFHAMAVFGEATKERDNWHGFRKADERKHEENKSFFDVCKECKKRYKCTVYLSTLPKEELGKIISETDDKEVKTAIAKVLSGNVFGMNTFLGR